MVDVGEPLSPDDLRRAADYVNREFHGLPLVQVRDALLARLNEERSLYDTLMRHAWDLAARSLARAPRTSALRRGHGHVGRFCGRSRRAARDAAGVDRSDGREAAARAPADRVPRRTRIDGGHRGGTLGPILQSLSLVASTFDDGHGIGSVGVIGPTRMRYSKAIAVVDEAARAISRVLDTLELIRQELHDRTGN